MRVNGRARPDGAAGLEITTREVYANCPKYIRPARGRASGGRHLPVRRGSSLDAGQMRRLADADTLFLASRHPVAGADVSHRGGARGFVHVTAPNRLVIPDYSGNMMFNTLGNLAADPRAGLLLVDFEHGDTLQLSGRARIEWDPAASGMPGAERVADRDRSGARSSRWEIRRWRSRIGSDPVRGRRSLRMTADRFRAALNGGAADPDG